MLANEKTWRTESAVRSRLLQLWAVMQTRVKRGCHTEGIFLGGLKVKWQVATLY